MKTWIKPFVFACAMCVACAAVHAQDTGAMTNGNWNDATIWTAGTIPGSSNNVYIGSTYPTGAAATSTVIMTQNQSASNIYLGNGSGTIGTLNLGSNTLTIGSTLTIGQSGGTGSIVEGAGGSFTAGNLYIEHGNSFTFGANDQVTNLAIYSSSSATSTATGNVTGSVDVLSGSTLNLGANLSLTRILDVENTGSVLNMNGNNISANTDSTYSSIFLGWYSAQAVTLDRGTVPGSLTTSNLYIAHGNTLSLISSDVITNLFIALASQVTTAAVGNVTGNVSVGIVITGTGTFNLGANLSLTGSLDVEESSVVHMNGNNISANTILLGWNSNQAVTLDRGTSPGSLTASNLYLYGNTLNLLPSDHVTLFALSNATTTLNSGVAVSRLALENGSSGTTTAASNVTNSVSVLSGSTLNLGANLSLSGSLDVEYTGSVVHMNGNNISANTILLGWYDGQVVTLDRGTSPGSLTATNLYVAGGNNLSLISSDVIANLNLSNAVVTTAAVGNLTGSVSVGAGGTLNLGANLSITGNMDVEGTGATVNAHGFNITAGTLTLGYNGTAAVSATNVGSILLNSLYLGNGSTMSIQGGVVNNLINLSGNSVLTVNQTNGTGLTLNGTSLSSLTIDPSSMDLIFNLNTSSNWDFRWQDPTGGNWISTLDSMIASGLIVVTAPQGYEVIDSGGYTYIEGNYSQSVVPEPASLLLACIASLGVAAGITWRRRHRGA